MRSLLAACLTLSLAGCGGAPPEAPVKPIAAAPLPRADGGMPRRGPGDLFNVCERIWCTTHEANFALDHFLGAHDGWVVHVADQGDVFVPRGWDRGPGFPDAGEAALNLCGDHVHPWLLGRTPSAIKRSGYNAALGYARSHFARFGTRLAPCCSNGLGWSYLHAAAPRQFRFSDVDLFREVTGLGWQAPFRARR